MSKELEERIAELYTVHIVYNDFTTKQIYFQFFRDACKFIPKVVEDDDVRAASILCDNELLAVAYKKNNIEERKDEKDMAFKLG